MRLFIDRIAESLAQLGVPRKAGKALGKGLDVGRLEQQSRLFGDYELRQTSDTACDGRYPCTGGLGDGVGEGLGEGADDVNVNAGIVAVHGREPACEEHLVRNALFLGESAERLTLLSLSGDEELELGICA